MVFTDIHQSLQCLSKSCIFPIERIATVTSLFYNQPQFSENWVRSLETDRNLNVACNEKKTFRTLVHDGKVNKWTYVGTPAYNTTRGIMREQFNGLATSE
jgi:hypothetical protein